MAMKSKKPLSKNQRKECWDIIRQRDFTDDMVPYCTLCGQEEQLGDNQNYKLTLGHINIKLPKYRDYYYSNHIVNITPQHFICNQRLEGRDFYDKHEQQLIKVLEKNIHYNNSYLAYKHEKLSELRNMDISELKNNKSIIYDNVIPKFLECFLKSGSDSLNYSQSVEDITAFIFEQHRFGSQKSTDTHLKKICNPYYKKYVIEENRYGSLIIRQMSPEERQPYDSFKTIMDHTVSDTTPEKETL